MAFQDKTYLFLLSSFPPAQGVGVGAKTGLRGRAAGGASTAVVRKGVGRQDLAATKWLAGHWGPDRSGWGRNIQAFQGWVTPPPSSTCP